MYYKLIRKRQVGKGVYGQICEVHTYFDKRQGIYQERLTPICETMENAEYLVPALIYKVAVTQSAKFKRLLPVLQNVPGRSGIRIHRGTKPEHSKGCILVAATDEQKLTALFLAEQNDKQEIRLEIVGNC